MITDVLSFRAECMRNGYTLGKLSEVLGINQATMSRKANGKADFTQHEMFQIKKLFNLSNDSFNAIFFGDELAEMQGGEVE